ncbi:hypothetical protein NECAME_03924 [Necator americanus]|uniref:Uncharacterized protein n=1 Tax=Necator americanus TaxID=51031 RepID=W2T0P1_NECAM|nr:hypothetical protein NECAME_03924 [Necator americanus]ETN74791.1 hypothetical protein NECAME_03924 [Necator americanus]
MVSTRSVTWTSLLIQLVMSVACLVASMAVIAAKLQSVSIYEDKQYVRYVNRLVSLFFSVEWWAFSCMSFAMILATVVSMFGLSGNKKLLLIPHFFLLVGFISNKIMSLARSTTAIIIMIRNPRGLRERFP